MKSARVSKAMSAGELLAVKLPESNSSSSDARLLSRLLMNHQVVDATF